MTENALTQAQENFLSKARGTASANTRRPHDRRFLKQYRQLMREAEDQGIHAIHPLLLGDQYLIGRKAAQDPKRYQEIYRSSVAEDSTDRVGLYRRVADRITEEDERSV